MGVATDFAIRPLADTAHDYQMQLKSHANAAEVNLADLGFGVSQLLPVIDDGFIILGEYQNKTRINPPRALGVVVALLRAGRPRSRWGFLFCGRAAHAAGVVVLLRASRPRSQVVFL